MPKLAVGVIGAGSIGNVHLTGYAKARGAVKIQAITDTNPKRLAEMGEKFKVTPAHLYSDYKQMLANEKLDVASICTPNAFHYECAAAAIKAGLHTLMEKPMVLTNEQAKTLRKLATNKKQKLMVAFSHRFVQTNLVGRKLIDDGAIGKPFMIRVRYSHGGPYPGWAQGDWFYKKKLAGGGALLDMGIHAIDICQFFIGPITSVDAQVRCLRKNIEVDDNAVMLLDFGPRAQCLGYIECGWTSKGGFVGLEIYGDKGTLILDLFRGPTLIAGEHKPDGREELVTRKVKIPKGPSHWPLQMENWVKYLKGEPTVTKIPGIDEGTSSLAVALAAQESSRTGRRVYLNRR